MGHPLAILVRKLGILTYVWRLYHLYSRALGTLPRNLLQLQSANHVLIQENNVVPVGAVAGDSQEATCRVWPLSIVTWSSND